MTRDILLIFNEDWVDELGPLKKKKY